MSNRTSGPDGGRRRSELLDAIFDAVDGDSGQESTPENRLFRARALEQINVAKQLDNLLPLTSLRTWIALAGVALLIGAGLVYAGGVVQTSAVRAVGRTVASPGIAVAASPADAVITDVLVIEGERVSQGQVVATGVAPGGVAVQVQAPIDGTVWQQLISTGRTAFVGDAVTTILPIGSDRSVLVAVPERLTADLVQGLAANVSGRFGVVTGEVMSVSAAPIPADIAMERLGVTLASDEPVMIVSLALDGVIQAGTEASVEIVVSQQTLLEQLTSLR
ncbi:unannotated protein [freshwater metagenome]|uniref:Unannotated protein n=1 Tax=freshwater metagenome TaxID=449393 RepID=A0A6J7ER47_9ZZZZ